MQDRQQNHRKVLKNQQDKHHIDVLLGFGLLFLAGTRGSYPIQ
jgi:hypothetical protein